MKRISLFLLLAIAAGSVSAQVSTTGLFASYPHDSNSKTVDSSDDDAASAAPSPYVRPDPHTRVKRYVNGLFGPVTLAKNVATAGYATWRNSPEEWGDHWEGFGRRVASNFGKNVIKQSVQFGLDETLKLDSHYYRSQKKDFGSKFTNAVISPFTARTEGGKRVIGIPRIAGTYTAHIVAAETWYPDRFDWKDGLKSGTISLGFNAAFNLVKEFVKK